MEPKPKEKDDPIVITPSYPEVCADPREGLNELRSALNSAADEKPDALIVNLEKVEYLDSIGLGTIVSGRLKFPQDCDFRVCNLGDKLDSILNVTGLKKIIQVDPDLKTAQESIENGP